MYLYTYNTVFMEQQFLPKYCVGHGVKNKNIFYIYN